MAGWLAWRAVQLQIRAEERRASADRTEVQRVLQDDVDTLAEALAEVWRILDGIGEAEQPDVLSQKLEAVIYGIEEITKRARINATRRMIAVLGWERRREYEALLDHLEQPSAVKSVDHVAVDGVLSLVKDVSVDIEIVRPECAEYFSELFRRAGKAQSLGESIAQMAGFRPAGGTQSYYALVKNGTGRKEQNRNRA
jgi:ubiquinone biosynthesis protein UbiJ